jgi:hypothetical protein
VPLCFHYGFLNLRTVSGDGAASLDSLLWNDMLAVCLQLSSLCLLEHYCVYIATAIFLKLCGFDNGAVFVL